MRRQAQAWPSGHLPLPASLALPQKHCSPGAWGHILRGHCELGTSVRSLTLSLKLIQVVHYASSRLSICCWYKIWFYRHSRAKLAKQEEVLCSPSPHTHPCTPLARVENPSDGAEHPNSKTHRPRGSSPSWVRALENLPRGGPRGPPALQGQARLPSVND